MTRAIAVVEIPSSGNPSTMNVHVYPDTEQGRRDSRVLFAGLIEEDLAAVDDGRSQKAIAEEALSYLKPEGSLYDYGEGFIYLDETATLHEE